MPLRQSELPEHQHHLSLLCRWLFSLLRASSYTWSWGGGHNSLGPGCQTGWNPLGVNTICLSRPQPLPGSGRMGFPLLRSQGNSREHLRKSSLRVPIFQQNSLPRPLWVTVTSPFSRLIRCPLIFFFFFFFNLGAYPLTWEFILHHQLSCAGCIYMYVNWIYSRRSWPVCDPPTRASVLYLRARAGEKLMSCRGEKEIWGLWFRALRSDPWKTQFNISLSCGDIKSKPLQIPFVQVLW